MPPQPPRPNHAPPRRPPGRAVALNFDPATMSSPQVVAAGQGEIAERIIALARQHDVPIKEDPDLVAVLAALDIGSAIPPELYQAVAEVLAFVYRLNAAEGARRPTRR
jgi:flagellar biosynthesis protein